MTSVEPGNGASDTRLGRSRNACEECTMRAFSVCGVLEAPELATLECLSQSRNFPAKSMLFDQSAVACSVYNVAEGCVRLYKSLPDGRRQIVGFALPGDFLGLALAERYGVTAEAVSDVKVCRFSRGAFVDYLDTKPHLLRRLHELVSYELSLAQDQMLLLGRRTAEEKVAAFLLNLQTRYSRIAPVSVNVPLPMSRQDIADYLGLTIETVSRTLTKLARAKAIVVVPDGIRLLAPERLDKLARA